MSQTILIPNMYQNLAQQIQYQTGQPPPIIDEEAAQKHFEEFYEDVWTELSSFGDVEELHVCNNLGDHLIGNVYAKFYDENSAAAAQQALNGRFYARRMLTCEFSPVTDFREARCRQFDNGECIFGGYCNFMHLYQMTPSLEKLLSKTKRKHRSSSRDRGDPYSRRDRDRRRYSRSPEDRGHRKRHYERDYYRREPRDDYHERRRDSRRERSRERQYSPDRDRDDSHRSREREREHSRDNQYRERERSRSRERIAGESKSDPHQD